MGDVLECVNGHSLNNAHHSQAVAVVKESKGLLDIVSILELQYNYYSYTFNCLGS